MLKLTEQIKTRGFSHLQVGDVYGGKMLMSKSFVEGGSLLKWCKVLSDKTLERI